MTLKEVQRSVDEWINTVGVRYFDELTNTVILNEEVGELCRIMARKYGEQSIKKGEESQMSSEALADEMADVLWVLVCLANQCDIDLEEAFQNNLVKKSSRDDQRHQNNPKIN